MSAFTLPPSTEPHLRRLDHLICLVPDISAAMHLFTEGLGFPVAWPIGRFWPQGLTSGVALGGLNLEFIQLDEGGPDVATIRTLVFEPVDIVAAAVYYDALGIRTELREKWEPDPTLLRLRGFSDVDSPQLICRNLVPLDPQPVDFFLCEYSPFLHRQLAPEAFPGLPKVREVVISVPGGVDARLFPIDSGADVALSFVESPVTEVVEIRTERGPLDLGDWAATFCLV